MNIKDIQEKEVEMLSVVDSLFRENNISYWLLGGSVLGSIRHSGFIPWDDDIDIGVMRNDIIRAEYILSSISQYLYESIENHVLPDAPIGHLHCPVDDYLIRNSATIDIFALDRIPNGKIKPKMQRFFANVYHLCVYRNKAKNRGIIKMFLTSIILSITPKFMLNFYQRISLKVITHWNNDISLRIGNLFGAWGEKEIFDNAMFNGNAIGKFENMTLPLPVYPDLYLRALYGDYMKLPPIEDRKPRHVIV